MSNILTFHMIRHGPVSNPDKIWYGRNVEFDLASPHIVAHFNGLAKILPTQPETTAWFASEYPRASKLAEFLLKACGRDVVPELMIDKDLIEQQYGEMEGASGLTAKQDPRFSGYFGDMWNTPPPGGESLKMLQERAGNKLDHLAGHLPLAVSDTVLVAHGGFNMACFAHVKNLRLIDVFHSKRQHATPSFSYMSHLELRFDREAGRWLEPVEYRSGLAKHDLG